MYKKLLFTLIALSISCAAFSQDGWYQQNSVTTANLKSVFFTDANIGYVAGYNGILKTTNGGLNWIEYTGSLNNGKFISIHFIAQTGFTVGGPLMFKTTDGGNSWINVPLPGNYILYDVFMTDTANVYSCGDGKIIRSTNAGLNWEVQNFDSAGVGIYRDFRTIFFLDSLNGFAGGNTLWVGHFVGLFRETNNGGNTWYQSSSQPSLTSVYFINTATGYGTTSSYGSCCPTYYIEKTTTGGESWTRKLLDSNRYFNSVRFHNSSTGYAAGFTSSGTSSIFKTTNAGINWFEQFTPPADSLNSIFLIDANTGYAVGNSGTILKTTNGGVSAIIAISNEIPGSFKLYQNYPNPFNPSTKLKFDISKQGPVKLTIYDITGREVITLVNKELNAGTYEAEFGGEYYPSGIYFYRLQTEGYNKTLKMSLIK